MKGQRLILGQVALLTMLVGVARAAEIQPTRTIRNADMATAGIGGIDTGNGSILLGGVNGTVSKAYLYWHGYNSQGAYQRPGVSFNGQAVTGRSLGVSSTNCWESSKPNGSSTAFEADVTALVSGNGSYSLAGLAGSVSEHANGASLVVFYQDGNTANDRDYVMYTGNDSSNFATAFGDSDGWHATLPGINYSGGNVFATLHVADGQAGADSALRSTTAGGGVIIPDSSSLYDGVSVPSGGVERLGNNLWDIHTLNITGAFGGVSGAKTLAVDTTEFSIDCTALINMTLSFSPGDAPDVGGPSASTSCASEGYSGQKLIWCKNICENSLTGRVLDTWIHRWISQYRKLPYCAVGGASSPN